ncbi:hypothetical protein ACH4MU_13355 [Streptomyces albidoflavus]
MPLAASLNGGNPNGITQLLPLLDKGTAVAGTVGRPRHRPDALLADRHDDHEKYRRLLRRREIRAAIAERGVEHGSGLGVFRYLVERTIAWPHGFRRRRIRRERRDDIHETFLGLATCPITHRHVQRLVRTSMGRASASASEQPGTASGAGQGDPVRPRCSFRQRDGGQRLVAGGWWSMPTSRPLRLASGGAQRRAPPRDERLSGEAPRRCADRRSQP